MALATPVLQKDIRSSSDKTTRPLNTSVSRGFPTHLLVEIWHAPFSALADAQKIGSVLQQAGSAISMEGDDTLQISTFQFDPYGVSGTATNSTIHILIHTWPEKGYAAIDIFSKQQDEAYAALERIKAKLNPGNFHVMELTRGQLLELEDT
ncbi:MAG: adenosylmethionine decarboxylase [Thermodesulfatator sp.]|nr:MAG: adenosylmethionine decarboxylase [Thermodesulfatator sp.]